MALNRRTILAQRASEMRKNMTPQERKLWYEFLCDYEVSFRCQKVIDPYIVDFYCRKARLSVEIDGSQHYEPSALRYDSIRTLALEMREIKELRFSNEEIMNEFEGVCAVIDAEVRSRRNDIHSIDLELVRSKR